MECCWNCTWTRKEAKLWRWKKNNNCILYCTEFWTNFFTLTLFCVGFGWLSQLEVACKSQNFWNRSSIFFCKTSYTIPSTKVFLEVVNSIFIIHFRIIFRVTLNIIEMMMASKVNKCGDDFCPPMLLMCAVPFTHLMLVLNSSANIVIYCLLGDGFRYIINSLLSSFLFVLFIVM